MGVALAFWRRVYSLRHLAPFGAADISTVKTISELLHKKLTGLAKKRKSIQMAKRHPKENSIEKMCAVY